MQNIHDSKAYCTLLSVLMVLLTLCSLLAAPAIGVTEAAFDTVGNALIVKEQSGEEWAQLKQLNIFSQAGTGDRPLFPSSSGSYTFTVENCARFPFAYTVEITDENLAEIPMQFRLRNREGDFIIGSKSKWVPITFLKDISGELKNQSFTEYTLDWMWPGTDNAADTASGILAQNKSVYALNFIIHAKQSGEPVAPDSPAQTGDPATLVLITSLLIVSLVMLTVLLSPCVVSRRKQQ